MFFYHCCQRGQNVNVTKQYSTMVTSSGISQMCKGGRKGEQEAVCMPNVELSCYLSPWVPSEMYKLPQLFLKGYLLKHLQAKPVIRCLSKLTLDLGCPHQDVDTCNIKVRDAPPSGTAKVPTSLSEYRQRQEPRQRRATLAPSLLLSLDPNVSF